jgi:hypothetical protein
MQKHSQERRDGMGYYVSIYEIHAQEICRSLVPGYYTEILSSHRLSGCSCYNMCFCNSLHSHGYLLTS